MIKDNKRVYKLKNLVEKMNDEEINMIRIIIEKNQHQAGECRDYINCSGCPFDINYKHNEYGIRGMCDREGISKVVLKAVEILNYILNINNKEKAFTDDEEPQRKAIIINNTNILGYYNYTDTHVHLTSRFHNNFIDMPFAKETSKDEMVQILITAMKRAKKEIEEIEKEIEESKYVPFEHPSEIIPHLTINNNKPTKTTQKPKYEFTNLEKLTGIHISSLNDLTSSSGGCTEIDCCDCPLSARVNGKTKFMSVVCTELPDFASSREVARQMLNAYETETKMQPITETVIQNAYTLPNGITLDFNLISDASLHFSTPFTTENQSRVEISLVLQKFVIKDGENFDAMDFMTAYNKWFKNNRG